jgi:hypothetical protein
MENYFSKNSMNRKQRLWSLFFCLVVMVSFSSSGVDIDNLCLLFLGFTWNWGLRDKRIFEKIEENRRYRFSFLRIYTIYGRAYSSILKEKNKAVDFTLLSVMSVLPLTALYAALDIPLYSLSFTFVGSLAFESLNLLIMKKA